MPTTNIGAQPVKIVSRDDPAGVVVNRSSTTQVFFGPTQETANRADASILDPLATVAVNEDAEFWAVAASGSVTLDWLPNGVSFFRPASLSGIGGSKVFVQATTPTGTIPLNSVWFDTANNSLQTWNGTTWVNQQFNATQLIQIATITATQVQNGTLTTTQLAAAAGILGSQIANATITSGNIAANTIVAGNIAANTITAAQLAAGIIYAGIVDGTTIVGGVFRAKNSFGATILTINKSAGTLLLYADTGSATQGALVFSAALAEGTDEFSNPFGAGAKAYGTGGNTSFVQMLPGNPVFLNVATGDPAEATPGQIQARIIGSGSTRFLSNDLRAAFVTGFPNAQAELQLFSVNAGGTTDAGVNLTATNPGATVSTLYHQTSTQFGLTGAPIIGDRAIQINDGINIWAEKQEIGSANHISKTNPTAAVDISSTLTIPANTMNVGTTFCIELPFSGVWEASGNFNLGLDLNGTVVALVPVASGLAVAGHNYGGVVRIYLRVVTTGAAGTCDIWSDGDITDTSVTRAGSTSSSLFGITTAHALNTTIANTMAVSTHFDVSNASQTVVGQGAVFSRSGV